MPTRRRCGELMTISAHYFCSIGAGSGHRDGTRQACATFYVLTSVHELCMSSASCISRFASNRGAWRRAHYAKRQASEVRGDGLHAEHTKYTEHCSHGSKMLQPLP